MEDCGMQKEEGTVLIASALQSESYKIEKGTPPERYSGNAIGSNYPSGPFPCGAMVRAAEASQECLTSRDQ
jgi:hypothetical protein